LAKAAGTSRKAATADRKAVATAPEAARPATSRGEQSSLARRTATIAGVVLAIALSAFIVIYAASGFLLIFAGILFAVLLDALTNALGRVLPMVARPIRLAGVCVAIALAVGAFFTSIGTVAVSQTPDLIRTLETELGDLRDRIRDYSGVPEVIEDVTGIDATGGEDEASDEDDAPAQPEQSGGFLADFLPDPGGLLGQVRVAFATTFGVIGNLAVIMVIGVFLAAQPQIYRDGAVKLVALPSRRRFGEVLDEIGRTLRFWLIGQFVTMCIIGVVVWAALAAVGMPGAILLALTAALFNFIPVIGPIFAGIPIVLVAMSQDWWVVAYALGVYIFVQMLEGNVLTPLIQRRAVSMPPALIMASLVIMGLLFGIVGVVLATPLAAVIMIAVKRLYIEDVLGDRA
jgi:predicted PurR-regulated permease PerM